MEVLRAARRCGERRGRTAVAGIKTTATETCGSLVGGEGVSGGRPVRGGERKWRRMEGKICRVAAWGWRRVRVL